MEVKYKKDELYHYGVKGMKWKHHRYAEDTSDEERKKELRNQAKLNRYEKEKRTVTKNSQAARERSEALSERTSELQKKYGSGKEGHSPKSTSSSSDARNLAYESSNRATKKAPKSDTRKVLNKNKNRANQKKERDRRTDESRYMKHLQKGQKYLDKIKHKLSGKSK